MVENDSGWNLAGCSCCAMRVEMKNCRKTNQTKKNVMTTPKNFLFSLCQIFRAAIRHLRIHWKNQHDKMASFPLFQLVTVVLPSSCSVLPAKENNKTNNASFFCFGQKILSTTEWGTKQIWVDTCHGNATCRPYRINLLCVWWQPVLVPIKKSRLLKQKRKQELHMTSSFVVGKY